MSATDAINSVHGNPSGGTIKYLTARPGRLFLAFVLNDVTAIGIGPPETVGATGAMFWLPSYGAVILTRNDYGETLDGEWWLVNAVGQCFMSTEGWCP